MLIWHFLCRLGKLHLKPCAPWVLINSIQTITKHSTYVSNHKVLKPLSSVSYCPLSAYLPPYQQLSRSGDGGHGKEANQWRWELVRPYLCNWSQGRSIHHLYTILDAGPLCGQDLWWCFWMWEILKFEKMLKIFLYLYILSRVIGQSDPVHLVCWRCDNFCGQQGLGPTNITRLYMYTVIHLISCVVH